MRISSSVLVCELTPYFQLYSCHLHKATFRTLVSICEYWRSDSFGLSVVRFFKSGHSPPKRLRVPSCCTHPVAPVFYMVPPPYLFKPYLNTQNFPAVILYLQHLHWLSLSTLSFQFPTQLNFSHLIPSQDFDTTSCYLRTWR